MLRSFDINPMKRKLTYESILLKFYHPFRLSNGTSTSRKAFWIRLEDDAGWGEGTIPPHYGIPDEAMTAFWDAKAQSNLPFPDDPAQIPAWIGDEGVAPARCALDLALHDRIAKHNKLPLYRLLGVPKPSQAATAFTISIASPAEMTEIARKNAQYPILKLKLGSQDDVARVAAVRGARPDARIYIDVNAAWQPKDAVRIIRALEPYHPEMIEQPTAKADIEGMGYVQAHSKIPIVADESIQTAADLEALAKAGVAGINLKLMKVGGLVPTLQLLRRGRELGMKIMLGCMSETAIGVTAMAHLSALADWIDLDAPLLIKNQPFQGLRYDQQAKISLPKDAFGIGVSKL